MSDTEKSIYYGHLLREFADTIESAGGVRMSGGVPVPVGDPQWSDLGFLYRDVCKAIGRSMMVEKVIADE